MEGVLYWIRGYVKGEHNMIFHVVPLVNVTSSSIYVKRFVHRLHILKRTRGLTEGNKDLIPIVIY